MVGCLIDCHDIQLIAYNDPQCLIKFEDFENRFRVEH